MIRESKQQAIRNALRRIDQGKGGMEGLEQFLESRLKNGDSQESVLDEITQYLRAIRECYRQGAYAFPLPTSQLISSFQRVALNRGISLEQFYPAILERFFLDAEPEDEARPQSKHSTKDKILDAALEIFSDKGFHLATVDEIAERAGVGKGTLYRYFANKEKLFSELVRLRLEELERGALAVLDGQDDVLTMISKYLRIYFEFFDRNQRLYRLIVQERLDVDDQVHDIYTKKVMRRIPLLKRKIHAASQQGTLKDVDFQMVFYGVMGFIHGVIQKWLTRDCSYSLVEELPGVEEILFYGFVNKQSTVNN